MDIALFHNPSAGYTGIPRRDLVGWLRREGYQPRVFSLDQALSNPDALLYGEFAVVAGGDGSMRQIALKLAGSQHAMVPLPVGTANNFAASLGIRGPARTLIAQLPRARRRRIDLGFVDGPWGRHLFIEGVSLGLFPRASRVLDEIEQLSESEFSTAEDHLRCNVSVTAALAREAPPVSASVELKGRTHDGDFLALAALNVDRLGPGVRLGPGTRPSDGQLDIVLVPPRDRARLTGTVDAALSGKKPRLPLRVRRGREVTFRPREDCGLLIDDVLTDVRANTVLRIGILPRALELLVPRRSA